MEVVVVGAFLNSVLPKLWDLIKDAHGLRYQIQGDIDYLKENLPIVDAQIQQHTLHCPSPSSEVAQMKMSAARRLAEDTEECISRFLLYQAHDRLRWKMNHSEFAVKIKGFRERLDTIKEDFSGLKQVSTTSPGKPQDPHFGKHRCVGMDVPYQELLELLGCTLPSAVKGGQPTNTGKGKLKVISIVGFGGSGKTRLAQQVYIQAGEQFGWKAWVRMEERNAQEVRQEILKFIGDKTSTSNNGASTSTGVHSDAKQRYLIVIDDVRTADDWHTLMEVLPDNDVGSRIIVTTTSQPVAKHCSSPGSHVYKMSTLSSSDSLELFSNASNRKFSDAHKAQLSALLKTCDGLPLALVESAKPFVGKTGVMPMECQKAVRNLCVPEEGTDVTTLTRMQWVLMNKYSGLTSSGARACLLYFHMFPFENPTKRKFLTRRWLAEGLVQRNGLTCSDLDAASDYLQTFSDGNIIQSMQVSSNATVKSCRIPGTMHQFISRRSMSENFVTYASYPNKLAEPNNVRRLSLHDGAADSEACIDGVNVSRLRTLAVSGKACEAIMDFSKYELLRVLDLKEWDYQDELQGICTSKCKGKCKGKCKLDMEKRLQDKFKGIWKLVMLKYLGLPGSIGEVPRQIQNLEELETLDVGETENIVELYGEVIKLPRLKHLLGRFGLSTGERPEDCVPKDSRLETLSGFCTNRKAAFPKLMIHMKQLRKVKMWCDFQESKDDKKELKDVSTAIQHFISNGTNVPSDVDRALSIDVQGCKAQFLESLEAPGRLTKLKLHGRLEKVPGFITPQKVVTQPAVPGNASVIDFVTPLNGLTSLCLSSTTLCGQQPVFPFPLEDGASLLPLLTYLKLDEDELGPLKILKQHFPSLERMCLVSKKSLDGITIEAGALEFLVSLHIMCKALDGLAGIQIKHLESLREIALDSQVTNTTKAAWNDVAKGHPNEPCVLFIEAASRANLSINQAVQSVSSHRWYRSPLNLLQRSAQRR